MHSANVPETMRRSSRVPITLPIAVTSLEPSAPFSEICETLVVSAHGCALFSPVRLEAGIPIQVRRKGGGAAKAHVVDCKPMDGGQQGWQVAAKLDRPENFWGLETCPEDWGRLVEIHSDDPQPARKIAVRGDKGQPGTPGLKIVSDKSQPQLTERDLRVIVADSSSPCMRKWWRFEKRWRRETRSAAGSISRCHTFHLRWKRNYGYACARTWGHKS